MADRDEAGLFMPGNRIWEAGIGRNGPKPHFADPEELRAACVKYFEWVTENPLQEEKLFSYEGSITRAETSKMQAMTIKGLQVFLGISQQSWSDYANRPRFDEVCAWVKDVIFVQKFTGAAAGLLNPAIIASELGLANKLEHSSPDGSMTPQIITRRVVDPGAD